MSDEVSASGDGPVTVVVTRIVAPGHEADYHAWMLRLLDEALKYPNSLGASVLTPEREHGNVHHLVHSFRDAESLRAWERSGVRRALSDEADAFSTSQRQVGTGLETWFSIPEEPDLAPPSKWKMALSIFVVAYVITAVLIPIEREIIPGWPFLASNVVTNIVMAALITYAAMPLITRVLRRWLYPSA
jgi:hypothetical protein